MLEPVFGESGAVVVQFFVILIFVLILTGVGYWLFQHYYGTGPAGSGRSRAPRLGLVDSMSIDQHHRLVLVRRDNVEHLLLIGKSADLVVESSIARAVPAGARQRQAQAPHQSPQQAQRPQQRGAAPKPPQPAAEPNPPQPTPAPNPPRPAGASSSPPSSSAPPAAPSRPAAPVGAAQRRQTTGISEPIPFPQNRRPQTRPAPHAAAVGPMAKPGHGDQVADETAQPRPGSARETPAAAMAPLPVAAAGGAALTSASAHFEEPTHPTRVQPAFSRAEAFDETADEPSTATDPQASARAGPSAATNPAAEPEAEGSGVADAEAPPTETAEAAGAHTTPVAAGTTAEQSADAPAEGETNNGDTADTVSNLEQEMARLLGEITSRRDG